MRKILRISRYVILSTAVVAFAAFIFIETSYFKSLIKEPLVSQLALLSGGTLTIEKVSGNIFNGVALKGVRLNGTGGQFIYAERIDASYSLMALLDRRIYFTKIVISGPIVSLSQDSENRWSSGNLFKPYKSGKPTAKKGFSVMFSEIRVDNGSFSLKYRAKPDSLLVNNIYLTASVGIKNGAADIVINSLNADGSKPVFAIKTLNCNARFNKNELTLKGLRVDTGYSRMSVKGAINNLSSPDFGLKFDFPEISLRDIALLSPHIKASGVFSGTMSVTGGLNALKLVQSLEYNSLKLRSEALINLGILGMSLNGRITGIKPCEILPIFTKYERNTCPDGEQSMDIHARSEGKNLDELKAKVSIYIHPSVIGGFKAGGSNFTASIYKRMASLEGSFELAEERFNLLLLGMLRNDAFSINKLILNSNIFSLASKGVIGYGKSGMLNITFSLGADDLGHISTFLPAVYLEGIVSSTGTIRGTTDSPVIAAELSGHNLQFTGLASGSFNAALELKKNPPKSQFGGNIDISGGSFTLNATGTEYRNLKAAIVLDDREIAVRQLALESGNGNAELTGKITRDGFSITDADLALKCRDFKVMNTHIFTGTIDADLKIMGLNASGQVKLIEAVINIPTRSRTDLSEIEFVHSGPGGAVIVSTRAAASPLFKRLMGDITLSVPGNTWVYAQNLSAEAKADLNITKKRNGPLSYIGKIDILRGVYKINERPLSIVEGKLLPRGSDIMASLIRAKASCSVGGVSIDVILGGTLGNPIISFQSEPPLERSEIISYLVFGAPYGNLSRSQSSALKDSSFDLVAGFAQKYIKDIVGRVVPIDELNLQPSKGSWGVGKNITDKLFAKYEWRSGQDESPQTVLNYTLDRHFSLNSQLGDPKTSGIDLFWKMGY